MLFAVAWGLSVSSLTLLGVRSSRASRIPLIITLVWVGAFFAFAWSTFPSSAAEARRDRVAPRAVPVYPGATFSKEEIWGESDDDTVGKGFLNPPYAYSTNWTSNSPHGVAIATIANWYETRLRRAGWKVSRDNFGHGAGIELNASRGGKSVAIVVYPPRSAFYPNGQVRNSPAEILATAGQAVSKGRLIPAS
jgi:hypothetical protein